MDEKTAILIKCSQAQKRRIEVLAKSEGKSVSDYLRKKGLNEST
jgi:hypothetical protein